MIPVRGYDGHRVAVLGLGRSGLATAAALKGGGAVPVCWDDGDAAQATARAAGYEVVDLTRAAAWDDIIALIVSPGIPHLYPAPHPVVALAMDRGVVVDNDVGLFFRSFATDVWDQMETPPRVVCVTGSNGKSTTTALIHHCLRSAGRGAQMGGNIGRGVLDLAPPRDGETVVLELSSYQTELARALSPDIAVFLNLSPDHLDRHGGIGGYFAAKRRLFTEGAPERSVVGIDTPEGRYLANRMREEAGSGEPVIAIANTLQPKEGWSVFARRGHLAEWRRGRQVASVDLRGIPGLPGTHNHQNACAAWAVLRALGLAPRAIEAGLRSYPGLAHRSQIIATRGGVTYVNDSKATNADAAAQSMAAFERLHWIAGGVPKEGGIAPLAGLFPKVAHAYLIGEAAEAFALTLAASGTPHTICTTLESAVDMAALAATSGDTVLLAPACASFDQFASFEARGDRFAALVAALDRGALAP